MGSKYFFRDEFNGNFETFDTHKEALDHAKKEIGELDGGEGWPQEVLDGAFQVGIITHESAETNRRKSKDKSFDYLCDIEMVEVETIIVIE